MPTPEEADRYLEQLLADDPPPGFDATGLPAHEVTPLQGKLLELLVRATRASNVLELGTLAGYSTICLARGVGPDGRVTTLELVAEHAAAARANVERAGLSAVVDIRVGPAEHTLGALDDRFNLIFIDADKQSNPLYLTESLRLSRPGTLIVADNVIRDGAVPDPETTDPAARGVRRFLEMLREDPRIDATAIQTVGAKGWDGFALGLVREA